MKYRFSPTRNARITLTCTFAVLALAALPGASVFAQNTTNPIPFQETFEQYSNGDSVVGTNGWYGTTNPLLGTATVTNMTYEYGLLPIPGATHTNVLFLDTGRTFLSNQVQSAAHTNVTIDMMVNFVASENDDDPRYTITNRTDTQMGAYVTSNGYITVYHSDNSGGGYSNVFTTFDQGQMPAIGSNDWARLTVTMDYLSDQSTFLKFFKVQLDAGAAFTNELAYVDPSDPAGQGKGGAWFLCANVQSIPAEMRSLDFQGTAHLDDLQVTTTNPLGAVYWTVTPSTENGGQITPSEKQLVQNGSDSPVFAITNIFGYVVTNVLIDGTTLIGPTNAYQFENVTANHTIRVLTEPETRTLTVSTEYGTPSPPNGVNTYDFDTVLQATLAGSPITTTTTQLLCTGWTGTGSVPPAGSTTDTGEFTLQADSSVTWNWQTNYWLDTGVNDNGSVDVDDGWFGRNTNVVITATPDQFYQFFSWTAEPDDAGVVENGNQVTLTMDKPRTITANFTMQFPTDLEVVSPYGTGDPPIGFNTFPNGSTQQCAILDSPVEVGTLQTQYVCVGWTRVGAEPDTGSGTTTDPFVLTEETTVTWLWNTNYWLDTTVDGNGSVDVDDGWFGRSSNVTITATADPFHHFDTWEGDIVGASIIDNQITVPMDGPRDITAVFAITDPQDLVVYSDQGFAVPPVGTNVVPSNTVQTCMVTNPVVNYGTMQTQVVCTGWTGTGSVPPSGTDTNTGSFTISNDSQVVWHWQTNYWVDIEKDGNGIVYFRDAWVGAQTNLTLIAQPSPTSSGIFVQWLTNGVEHETVNTQTVVQIGAPIVITAEFVLGDPVYTNFPSATEGGIITPSEYEEVFEGYDGGVFTITNEFGYEVTNVLIDGTTFIGPTNSYQFTNVQQNHTIEVLAQGVDVTLDVTSPHGTPTPPVGQTTYTFNEEVTCSVAGSPEQMGTTQYVCTGWAGTGSVPASGDTTSTGPFNIQAASTIDWLWQTNYWLDTETDGNGTVDVSDGWYEQGSNVVITATPNAFYTFTSWTGDTNGCTIAGDQITAPMTTPRSITANFELADPKDLVVISPYGTPDPPVGTNVYGGGSSQECVMPDSPITMGTTQVVCTGWVGTGDVPATGSTTNTGTFTLNQDSSITWLWQTNYWVDFGVIDLTSGGGGSTGTVDKTDGWYASSTSVQVTATPIGCPESTFIKFVLNGVDYSYLTNPETFTITQASTIEAGFTGGTPCAGDGETSRGTPHSWLDEYGLVSGDDYESADLGDPDMDHALNWEEYLAGTVPTNAASVFEVTVIQVGSGSNLVAWYGTTNSGVTTPFGLERTTNLMDGAAGWLRITDDTGPRAADGNNSYWDTSAGAGNGTLFYRPVVTN